ARFVGRNLQHPSDQEVADLHPLVRPDDDAVGAQTAVREPAAVRMIERTRDLLQDANAGCELERAYGLEHALERAALHPFGGVPQKMVGAAEAGRRDDESEEHTSELQSRFDLVCRLLLEKKKECNSSCNES